MTYYHAVAGAAIALACASTPSIENTDARLYLASAETTRSEIDVFPETGRGEANSNAVLIPVSDLAKDRVHQLIKICTGESS